MSSPIGNEIQNVTGLLRTRLPADMVVTEQPALTAASRVWNAQVSGCPAVVARCRTTADVQAAVRAARTVGMPLSVLSGSPG